MGQVHCSYGPLIMYSKFNTCLLVATSFKTEQYHISDTNQSAKGLEEVGHTVFIQDSAYFVSLNSLHAEGHLRAQIAIITCP